jgi:pimeloyl-ACP methyl ester carboxylesterase
MVPVDQVAVVLPGAGSSADFVRRAFERPLREAGYALVAPSPVPGADLVAAAYRSLDLAAAEHGPRLRLVGGVSLGAHVAARWTATHATPTAASPSRTAADRSAADQDAADQDAAAYGIAEQRAAGRGDATARGIVLDGLLLALPAWTGQPGTVAAATAASADLVERLGTAGALATAGTAVKWVAAELAAAWPAYGDRLAASLRAAAASSGPTLAELAAIAVPVGVVTFADDPLHPAAVAREWAAALPRAAVRELPLGAPATDRSALGIATLAALRSARGT